MSCEKCTFTKSICPDKRGVDLISDTLPFGRLWYSEIPHAIGYAEFYSRSHDAVIRIYGDADNVIQMHEPKDKFKGVVKNSSMFNPDQPQRH